MRRIARIRVMKFLLKVAAFWVAATLAHAQALPTGEDAGQSASAADPAVGSPPLVLPDERRWRLGAALGYGERSNPLIQSDDIPVVIDLDIAYFGDRWFFDNGDLGLQVLDNAVFTTNLVARVNSDRAFFSKTNTRYVTYSLMAGGATTEIRNSLTGAPLTPTEALPLKPPDRSYAIEAGIETLFGGGWGQASLRAFHDVSGAHEGYEIAADYSYRITRGRMTLSPSVGLSWKSAAMSDYYWGVQPDEADLTLTAYEAGGGLGWQAGMKMNYYVTKKTRIAVSANYERLQHSVAMSPLVEQDYVLGYFAGMAWQF
jgi:MipA family protein